ncbi:copper amine oxidase N-terminal domain-containing protein [Paenibacillus alba]|uniref:Copper amine oxidase N-terminal domain-containing protein n=1 Tax=Paenibacillus alba TaxID=1197127 RepID=A0ABU6GAI6_9BACL|nr:copper amine oxidase N-terminal domain-containing protein [Paenibacillus alba]MEC0230639.1 copper amine oxidase N-terminal domain-containing protein [Paenibacillus alba]
MKTWKKVITVTVVACTLALPTLASAEEMMKSKFDYSGVQTITQDGTQLVPLRQVAESLGFKVTWNGENRSVTLMKSSMMMEDKSMDMGTGYTIRIDSKTFKAGDMDNMLMTAPMIVNDMTYVPKEFVDTYLVKEMMMK